MLRLGKQGINEALNVKQLKENNYSSKSEI
jgi:hypothetical protein